MNEQLHEIVSLVRSRLWRQRVFRLLGYGLAGGLVSACLWAAVCLFVPVAFYRPLAFVWAAAGLLASIAYGLYARPTVRDAARVMDGGGLEERIGTALSFAEEKSPVAILQREDALQFGRHYLQEMPSRIRFGLDRRTVWASGGAALALIVLLMLPNAMDEIVDKKREERKWIGEQTELAETMLESLRKKEGLGAASKSMEETLEELERKLAASKTADAALSELGETIERLQQLAERQRKEVIKSEQFAGAMQNMGALSELGKAMLEQREGELDGAIDAMRQQLAGMDGEQLKELAAQLGQLAESAAAADPESAAKLRDALSKAAGELGAGALSAEARQQLAEALAAAMQAQRQSAALAGAAQQASAALAQAGLPMAQQLAALGAAPPPAWASGGIAAAAGGAAGASGSGVGAGGATGASGSGAGAGGATGAGGSGAGAGGAAGASGSGAGAGGAAGASGSGAGAGGAAGASGSGAGAGGAAGAGGSGAGAGGAASAGGSGAGAGGAAGAGGSGAGTSGGSRSLVSTPRASSGGGTPTLDSGPINGSGGETEKGVPVPVAEGESRPYEEVYTEYATEVTRSLDRSELPQSVQSLVRSYFTEIQPNR